MQQKSAMQALIQQHLTRAKTCMKAQADKNHTERSFTVGDWVYAKLQPYVQTSVAPRANQKLAYRFFRPFQIVEKVGPVAYKLLLPAASTVHPVFHVSQLKGAVPVALPTSPLPVSFAGLQVPERTLQKRVVNTTTGVRLQALIQWTGLPTALASWEDVEALRQGFSACTSLGASWFL
jgi:hypothetical protein